MTTINEINSFIRMKHEQIKQSKLDAERVRLEAWKNPLTIEETQKFLTHLLEQGEKGFDIYGSGPLKYEEFVDWYMHKQLGLKMYAKMTVDKGYQTYVVKLVEMY